jgi:hypothetical protein
VTYLIERLPGTFEERLATAMDRHEAERAGGAMRHGALHLAHPDAGEVERLRALLADVLGSFTQSANLGGRCLRTGWVPEDVVEQWRHAARGDGAP